MNVQCEFFERLKNFKILEKNDFQSLRSAAVDIHLFLKN